MGGCRVDVAVAIELGLSAVAPNIVQKLVDDELELGPGDVVLMFFLITSFLEQHPHFVGGHITLVIVVDDAKTVHDEQLVIDPGEPVVGAEEKAELGDRVVQLIAFVFQHIPHELEVVLLLILHGLDGALQLLDVVGLVRHCSLCAVRSGLGEVVCAGSWAKMATGIT
eukprot:7389679-Heterocapsa_arctica.AAC.1